MSFAPVKVSPEVPARVDDTLDLKLGSIMAFLVLKAFTKARDE